MARGVGWCARVGLGRRVGEGSGGPHEAAVSVGGELRRLREGRRLSLADLAARVHYSKGYLSKLENGSKRITPDIASACDRVLEADGHLLGLVSPGAVCPYPGLAAFGHEHAQWFFGREHVVEGLVEQLLRRPGYQGPYFVVGASGAGKSSLLRAGLLPALREGVLLGAGDCVALVVTPTADPLAELARQLAGMAGVTSDLNPQGVERQLKNDPTRIAEIIRNARGPAGHQAPVVLVVDQFEEVFTLCKDTQRRHDFIRSLCAVAAAGSPRSVFVVAGLRADFYAHCMDYPELVTALRHGHLPLGAMSNTELRRAIEKPATAVGLDVEPGLTEIMLRDLGALDDHEGRGHPPGRLPLLAHALLATWEKCDGHRLTLADYQQTGGIGACVAATADEAYSELGPQAQTTAKAMLVRLVEIGDDSSQDARRRLERSQLTAGMADSRTTELVLNTLVHARLITIDADTVEVVHECLLRTWPRFREWIEIDRAGLLIEQRLGEAAAAWDHEGRHAAGLYRGPRLQAARERVASSAPNLHPTNREFLRASTAQEDAERRDGLRRTRNLRRLVVVLCVLVVLTVYAAVDAIGQRDAARSRAVASEAVATLARDPSLAGQLALVALDLKDTPEARGAAMTAELALDPAEQVNADSADAIRSISFNVDGSLFVAASQDRTARVWTTRAEPKLGPPIAYLEHGDQVLGAVFDRDRWLITSAKDNVIRWWPIAGFNTGTGPQFQRPSVGGPIAVSGDGALLATLGGTASTIRLWDLSGTEPRPWGPDLSRHHDDVLALAFTPDRKTLITAGADGMIVIWDITDPRTPHAYDNVLSPGSGPAQTIAVSSDGRLLVSGQGDATVAVWNIEKPGAPRQVAVLPGFPGPIGDVEFSPDGGVLAVASGASTQLWDLSNAAKPALVATSITADAGEVRSMAFRPDGHILATASQSGAVQLWETDVQRANQLICGRSTHIISEGQWSEFLSDRSYDPPCPRRNRTTPPAAADRTPTTPNVTQLRAQHSNKCVAIQDGVAAVGAPARQFTCGRGPGLTWSLQPQGAQYRIHNESSGMCLESTDHERRIYEAVAVVQRPCSTSVNQMWRMQIQHTGSTSTEVAFLAVGQPDYADCLNINQASPQDGASVIRWPCTSPLSPNTLFQISTTAIPQG